ncbi:hypothetical protein RHMOL_Rhmol10G0211200 [Rhododendron molle]|uniref:Uncharacterized protein n=1 Tax=Rhododendron molle TaxID=49168 RepID=A0ACC0M5V7_RHOML|nr:hypothetical protein RHMOL_Rhmol10G0211200 [Rhododendron molle]
MISSGLKRLEHLASQSSKSPMEFQRCIFSSWLKLQSLIQHWEDAAEKAKLELSSSNQTPIDVPYLTADGDGVLVDATRVFSHSEFEELTKPLSGRITELCLKCLDAADVSVDNNGVFTVLAKSKDDKALEWSKEFKDLDEIGEDGVKTMASMGISRVEFSIEALDKMLYTRRKGVPS